MNATAHVSSILSAEDEHTINSIATELDNNPHLSRERLQFLADQVATIASRYMCDPRVLDE